MQKNSQMLHWLSKCGKSCNVVKDVHFSTSRSSPDKPSDIAPPHERKKTSIVYLGISPASGSTVSNSYNCPVHRHSKIDQNTSD